MPVEQSPKPELLAALIRQRGADRVLVFTKTKSRADLVKTILEKDGFNVAVMHADRTQQQRDSALKRFREGNVDVLVATDIIARGIDITDIDHVVNYDVPENPEDYVHRIGRTARAGASGYALTLLGPDEMNQFREIEYLLGEHIPTLDLADRREGASTTSPPLVRTAVAKNEPAEGKRKAPGGSIRPALRRLMPTDRYGTVTIR